ncbi:unnamed protein product [Penicillium bialowiezense]
MPFLSVLALLAIPHTAATPTSSPAVAPAIAGWAAELLRAVGENPGYQPKIQGHLLWFFAGMGWGALLLYIVYNEMISAALAARPEQLGWVAELIHEVGEHPGHQAHMQGNLL